MSDTLRVMGLNILYIAVQVTRSPLGSVLSDSIPWVIAMSPWYPEDAAAQFAEQPQLLHACEESHGEHIGAWRTGEAKMERRPDKFWYLRAYGLRPTAGQGAT